MTTTNPVSTTVGQRIQADRRTAGMTQIDLAAAAGVSQGAVARWEADDNHPALPNMRRLAELLGWDDDTLRRFAMREDEASA